MGYVWELPDESLTLHADYIGSRSEEVHAELRVLRNGKHLHLARFNLTSSQSRGSLAKSLSEQTSGITSLERWKQLLEQFSVGILQKERAGEPTRYTAAAERRRLTYLVDHLIIKGKTNMLFAPGGSGKGYLCVGLCCAVASRLSLGDLTVMEGRPFYFDWEDDFETFEDRLNRVAFGLGVDVPRMPYRRMRGLATERINEMARALSDEGATLAVIDSFSAAGGTTSERTSWDTVAHRLFDALDMIPNMTWLIIDHVAGDKVGDPAGKAFGSIQKMNRVRNAWEMRSEQEPGAPTVHMKLFDAKWNHTGKRKPMGMRMDFEGDGVMFESEDPSGASQIPGTTTPMRMMIQLAVEPLTTVELAKRCKVQESTIRAEVSRNRERFRRTDDGLIHLVRDDVTEVTRKDLPWQ
jgi:hypothetical protein